MSKPTILVIVGITGDLSKRKLLPAIEKIAQSRSKPDQFKIVGVTRQAIKPRDIIGKENYPYLEDHLSMFQMDLTNIDDYEKLKKHLADLEKTMWGAQKLFYLSVPPQISQPIVELLGKSGLANGETKLLLEKPFGTDLASAEELIQHTKKHFEEDQLYRIDHYLAKEMAQNLIVFREGNALIKRTWNKDFIESITIVASEKIGIEGRTAFYEQTGALRDIVQSHLLQLAALTLMDSPAPGKLNQVPARRLQALQNLHVPHTKAAAEYAVRGQYKGYEKEVENPGTTTETFVRLELESDDERWKGVPITLLTGKGLAEKSTEVRLTYKKDELHEANELRIKLQPDEGIELRLWAKVPGYEWRVEQHELNLAFRERFGELPEAYEQVLVDAINSNHTLFTGSDEVLESWRIIEPLRRAWEMSGSKLIRYKTGEKPESIAEKAII